MGFRRHRLYKLLGHQMLISDVVLVVCVLHLSSPRHHVTPDQHWVAESMRVKAEVYHGDKTCRNMFCSLLTDIGLPNRLLSNQEIEECGYVKDTGFVWLKHKKKKKDERKKHQDLFRFDNVVVCFEDEVTAYFQPNMIKKLTGVKAKEFVVWISLGEIHVNRPSGLITFKTQVGLLSKSLPLSVFEDVQGNHDVMEKPKQDQQKFNDPKIYLY